MAVITTVSPALGLSRQAGAPPARLEFQVVESLDAAYLGDTPGHKGRSQGLGQTVPTAALGDPVYRGEVKVGTITHLLWDRTKENLEVEFDPEPKVRIAIGDHVWLSTRAEANP